MQEMIDELQQTLDSKPSPLSDTSRVSLSSTSFSMVDDQETKSLYNAIAGIHVAMLCIKEDLEAS